MMKVLKPGAILDAIQQRKQATQKCQIIATLSGLHLVYSVFMSRQALQSTNIESSVKLNEGGVVIVIPRTPLVISIDDTHSKSEALPLSQ